MTRLAPLRRAFRRPGFLQRQDGAAAIEVALLFPLMMWPFMMAMEAGFMQMKRVMFERAVDVTVRQLRLGDSGLEDADDVKDAVCSQVLAMDHCTTELMLEMTPVAVRGFTPPAGNARCVDRTKDTQPVLTFTPGAQNQLMMMRFCILYDPILPGVGIGARMTDEPGRGVAMTATTFFVNEPE